MRSRLRFSLPLSVAALLCCLVGQTAKVQAQYAGAEPPPEALAEGFESITAEQCKNWLNILAGPGFAGRGTGQPGHVKAAHWVAGKCAEFGLEPLGDADTYFQMLPMSKLQVASEQSKLTGPDGLTVPFTDSISLDRFNAEPLVTGNLSFVGISGAEAKLDNSSDLRGKIVVLSADDAAEGRGIFTLTRQRPAAILQVVDVLPKSASQLKRGNNRRRTNTTSGFISKAAAEKLLEAVSGEAEWLEIPSEENTASVNNTDKSFTMEARVFEEPTSVPNVLAWYPGSDPELADEYLVIGAHLDHLGVRGDTVYPGADDNGSGSTAILNIAKAISQNPVKPKRSILFMWFAAEEMGLVGSRHYVENPILPLDKMIAMLNLDMVGRNEEVPGEPASENIQTLHLVGSKKGDPAFHEMILDVNKHVNVTFEYDQEGVFGRSDQINFFRKGASVAFMFGGFHPDYHRPGDVPEKINYDKIASAAKLFYLAAHEATSHGFYPVPEEEDEQPAKKIEEKAAKPQEAKSGAAK
ncbi:MAG: M20/M25/M40 family metallo-hydrolase [Planctomycetota bacterium]